MTSFVNKVIADVIGYINERLVGWVQHDWCSYEKGNLDTETQGECLVNMKTAI